LPAQAARCLYTESAVTALFQDVQLSVVVPATDHRGHLLEGLSSWTQGQTLARERYEVLLVTSGREPELVAAASQLLTADDRVLTLELANEQALDDYGARRARGKWLLFTEAHCVAAPNCLAELLAYLEAHEKNFVGACLRSTTDGNPHPLARLEERSYEEGFAEWSAEGDWRKVIIRGFAIRRDIYLEVGGFQGDLGCFAEVEIAVALNERGYRMGYACAAAVKHYNSPNLSFVLNYIREYREGQVTYQFRCPPARFESYFGWYGSWADASPNERRIALSCAMRSFFRASIAMSMLPLMGRLACDAITGGRFALLKAAASYIWARLRFAQPWLEADERYRRYCLLWNAAGELGRQRALSRVRSSAQTVYSTEPARCSEYQPGLMSSDTLLGFHGRETWKGQPFRWSTTLAIVRLSLEPGKYEVRLETRGLRGCVSNGIDLYLEGRQARPLRSVTNSEGGDILFAVDATMFRTAPSQHLVITTSRFAVADPKEKRVLGLPIFKITFMPDATQRRVYPSHADGLP
jgi:Glycosyltransferase like family 2